MSYNESTIISALQCCIENKGCRRCPFSGKSSLSECLKSFLSAFQQKESDIERYRNVIKILENDVVDVVEAKKEAYRELGHFLIDKSKSGVISIADIPDYVLELTKKGTTNDN